MSNDLGDSLGSPRKSWSALVERKDIWNTLVGSPALRPKYRWKGGIYFEISRTSFAILLQDSNTSTGVTLKTHNSISSILNSNI